MFRSILVAWDGSSHARRALEEAIDIARTQDARLTLLTVAAPVNAVWAGSYVPPVSEGELTRAAQELADEGEDLVPDGIAVSSRVADGHPGSELLKRAEAANHDLIVMGSRGRGAVKSAVLGSVSHFVLNHTEVPVLIVHAGEQIDPQREE